MTENTPSPAQPIDAVKTRIREAIRAAMTAKSMKEAKVLRTLLAALDNAEALPVAPGHTRYVERPFGDKSVEVARKMLTAEDIEAVIKAEHAERIDVAHGLKERGRIAEANDLNAEAALIARYMQQEV